MAFVQLYRSSDTNAPVLTGQAGKLTDLLDAVLVNGYTTASISSLTRSGSTLTFTISSNTTLRTGDYIVSSGWDQSDYNGTFQIIVVSPTSFTASVTSSQATTATGTGLYKKAPLGWSTAYTSTNVRAYRSPNTASNRFYLRIDDNTLVNVREAYAVGYETMSDINTGTGQFPLASQNTNGLSWNKSTTADATARSWAIVGDDKTFYIFISVGVTAYFSAYGFGHFIPTKPADGFNTFITGYSLSNWTTSNPGSNWPYSGLQFSCALNNTSAVTANRMYVPRGYTQIGGSTAVSAYDGRTEGAQLSSYVIGHGVSGYSLPYPNGPDNGIYVAPIYCIDHGALSWHFRGRFPGIYGQMHGIVSATASPFAYGDFLTGVVGISGATLVAIPHSANVANNAFGHGIFMFDVTGPWT